MMLKLYMQRDLVEAGCDEAGRGCLSGPVFAAAVIWPKDYILEGLDDSKKLNAVKRLELRKEIISHAIAWSVAKVNQKEIDRINILNASFKAMHLAIQKLKPAPEHLLIDGNRFNEYTGIKHTCIVKGDSKYASIAAASILAKTYRDEYMEKLDKDFPGYLWKKNKGYPTKQHKEAIRKFGMTSHHRVSFKMK